MSAPPATLADLVAPLSKADFLHSLHRRELVYRSGGDDNGLAPLVGWQALRRRLESGEHPDKRDDIRVTKDSAAAPPDRWMTNGKVDVTKLDQLLASGFSIVVVNIEPYVPPLAAVCHEIRTQHHEDTFVGVIVTAGTGAGAFRTHYDPEDLIIVQVEGTKRWQIFGPPVANPLRGMPKQPPPPETTPLFDEVLEPGDLLFVPGGNWHRCESGLSTSVHLGIFWLPPTGWHAINRVLKPLLAEEAFRTPLTRLAQPAELAAMEAAFKQRVMQQLGELKLQDFIAGWGQGAT